MTSRTIITIIVVVKRIIIIKMNLIYVSLQDHRTMLLRSVSTLFHNVRE